MRVNRYAAATFLGLAIIAATAQAAPDTLYIRQLDASRQNIFAQNSRGQAPAAMPMSHESMMQMCNDMMGERDTGDKGRMRMQPMRDGSSTVPYGAAFFNKANGGVSPP